MTRPKEIRLEIAARPASAARSLAARIRAIGAARAGTRSSETVMAGAVVVAVLPALLPKLVELLNSWLAVRRGRSVRIKVSRRDAAIEVEFAPGERGADELLSFVDRLDERLTTKRAKPQRRKGPGL